MKKKRLVRINLNENYFGFALIIDQTFMTFFDFITKDKVFIIESILQKPILFTNAVSYKQVLKTKEWEVIGEVEINDYLLEKRPYYIQDPIDKDLFFISNPPNYDEMEKVTKKECLGLEKMLVYYPEHVVDRLNHHFFDTKIKWESSLPFWLG